MMLSRPTHRLLKRNLSVFFAASLVVVALLLATQLSRFAKTQVAAPSPTATDSGPVKTCYCICETSVTDGDLLCPGPTEAGVGLASCDPHIYSRPVSIYLTCPYLDGQGCTGYPIEKFPTAPNAERVPGVLTNCYDPGITATASPTITPVPTFSVTRTPTTTIVPTATTSPKASFTPSFRLWPY